ncbi:hypothetical protein [Spiroplasma endosymbiont of Clivina fossor]|uniref:hypothetical protein n=1 Tax=Spiroplasma endosymbiont of Clivina fossor TaxID=3066282 RepID=UPI00313DC9CC
MIFFILSRVFDKIKRIKYKNAIKNNTGNFTKDEKIFIARFEEWVKAPNSKENNENKK